MAILILLAIAAALASSQQQQIHAQQLPQGCGPKLGVLLPCLPFLQGQGSNPTQPCCNGLEMVVKSNPACLCALVNSQLGNRINITLALLLPSLCNLAGVTIDLCNPTGPPPVVSPPVLAPPTPLLSPPYPSPAPPVDYTPPPPILSPYPGGSTGSSPTPPLLSPTGSRTLPPPSSNEESDYQIPSTSDGNHVKISVKRTCWNVAVLFSCLSLI